MEKFFISSRMLEQYLTNTEPEVAEKVVEIFEQAEIEKMNVIVHSVVLMDCVNKLSIKFPRPVVADALTKVLLLDGVTAPEKETVIVALDIYGHHENATFPDAYLSALQKKGYGEMTVLSAGKPQQNVDEPN